MTTNQCRACGCLECGPNCDCINCTPEQCDCHSIKQQRELIQDFEE